MLSCATQCQAVTYQCFQCQFSRKLSKESLGARSCVVFVCCSVTPCIKIYFKDNCFTFTINFLQLSNSFFSRSPSIVEASSLNGLAILSNGQLQHVDRSESKQRATAIVRCKRVKQKSIMVRKDTLRGSFSASNSVFTYINELFRCYRRNWRPGTNTFKVQATRTNTHIRSDWLPD